MSPRTVLAAIPLVFVACAAPRSLSTTNVAHATFPAGQSAAVFEKAVRSISRAGYGVVACDAERGVLETDIIEFDAPCGKATCLARQVVRVKLGRRAARVTVRRELYDSAWQSWQADAAVGAADAAQTLALDIVAVASAQRTPADPDPCDRVDIATNASPAR